MGAMGSSWTGESMTRKRYTTDLTEYDYLPETTEANILLAMIHLMLKRLAR
jgi:hypothetical protein